MGSPPDHYDAGLGVLPRIVHREPEPLNKVVLMACKVDWFVRFLKSEYGLDKHTFVAGAFLRNWEWEANHPR